MRHFVDQLSKLEVEFFNFFDFAEKKNKTDRGLRILQDFVGKFDF